LSRLPKARRRLRLVPDFSSPQSRRGELCSSSPVPVCVPLVLSCFSRNNRRRVRVFRLKCAAGCQSFVLGFTPQLWCRFTSATAPPGFSFPWISRVRFSLRAQGFAPPPVSIFEARRRSSRSRAVGVLVFSIRVRFSSASTRVPRSRCLHLAPCSSLESRAFFHGEQHRR
jgi:hypothetical protein